MIDDMTYGHEATTEDETLKEENRVLGWRRGFTERSDLFVSFFCISRCSGCPSLPIQLDSIQSSSVRSAQQYHQIGSSTSSASRFSFSVTSTTFTPINTTRSIPEGHCSINISFLWLSRVLFSFPFSMLCLDWWDTFMPCYGIHGIFGSFFYTVSFSRPQCTGSVYL